MLNEILDLLERGGDLFPYAWVLFGTFGIGVHIKKYWRKAECRQWPVTEGRVVRSEVVIESLNVSDSSMRSSRYEPAVEYEYVVRFKTYTGNQIGHSSVASRKERAVQKIADRYPEGSTVDVWYNPGDPKVALLDPDYDPVGWVLLASSVLVVLAGAAWLLASG